jgi:hypothetical protein
MLRWLPILILVSGFFLFLPNYKHQENKVLHELENGCLVYALHLKMTIDAQERLEPYIWTRIIAIQFQKTILGHAILVFVYKNMTFVYDPAMGSFVAARYPLYDPMTIAEIAYPKIAIKSAYFLEPTITLTYP